MSLVNQATSAKSTLRKRLRYVLAVSKRFKLTVVSVALLFGVLPWIYIAKYPLLVDGNSISYGRALHHVYFLIFGQPSLEYVNVFVLEALDIVIPPFAILTVVDGAVRFSYYFNARARADREWK